MWPPAKTITMSAAPMASGAMTPEPAPITVQPIVRTRKNVPMNSAMYLFMVTVLADGAWEKQDTTAIGLWSYGGEMPKADRNLHAKRQALLPLFPDAVSHAHPFVRPRVLSKQRAE